MKIAVLGGGFTGLAASLRLLQKSHQVTIFEKESDLGGLAIGFKRPGWKWSLEKAYHHWFTNDNFVLSLAKEINHPVIVKRPQTKVLIKGKAYSLDSAKSLLLFPHLSLIERLRMGIILLIMRTVNNYQMFEGYLALPWLEKFMGKKATKLIWDPLFSSKFGNYKNQISLVWFWARIKKRTPNLAYPEGGFKHFTDHLVLRIKDLRGKISLNTQVNQIKSTKRGCLIKTSNKSYYFDRVIVTLPSPIFSKICSLPSKYTKKITSTPHLHAQVVILISKKPILKDTYWLNIADSSFPFLVLAEHTNFMDAKNYLNQSILYIGNYLKLDHPFLKMSKNKLLKTFDPYLKKINPKYKDCLLESYLFIGPFAQPIITPEFSKNKPHFKTPLKNVYLANLDMVYPWDRGTNYAIELGEKVAKKVMMKVV